MGLDKVHVACKYAFYQYEALCLAQSSCLARRTNDITLSPAKDKFLTFHRLLWPEGTIIYEIAPSEAHTVAYKALKEHKASVSRGSLFRRVPWDFKVTNLTPSIVHLLPLSRFAPQVSANLQRG